jgi:hypothetical protein
VRRILQIPLYATAAISLAACLVFVVLHFAAPRGGLALNLRERIGGRVDDGKLLVGWAPTTPRRPAWAGQINRYGFRYSRWSDGSAELGVPLWFAAAAFAALCLGMRTLARRSGRTAPAGLCPACGYDLRATPDRCPECGTIPA